MRRYGIFVGFLLFLVAPISAQQWVEGSMGSDKTAFHVSCDVLKTPLRGPDAERDLTLTLWQMIFHLLELQGVELEGELLALSESLHSLWQNKCSEAEETLTVRSPIWDATDGDLKLIDMVVSNDSICYLYIDVARDVQFASPAERMMARQQFVADCV
ncbi:MAG: hypothetical protein OXN94_18255 [Chloroflexota bacterium]|nr:hypothetical protein [Chloroflexota bacterium]MDE2859796.1 hypothetical protein [Chloroflexota bacterium]